VPPFRRHFPQEGNDHANQQTGSAEHHPGRGAPAFCGTDSAGIPERRARTQNRHGISKRPYFLRETPKENLAVMNRIKTAIDPKHILNDQKSYIVGGK